MRKVYLLLCIFIYTIGCFAQEETDDLIPSGTLPILYINTIDDTPIDQKEYYVDATAWLDASMTDEFDSVGSAEEPLALGIRGRGNTTWSQSEQKPYKLKFDKKQSIMGNNKSKHFALLHLRGAPTAYYNEPLAFHAVSLLGDAWVPSCKPCEVVLNGHYAGLYFFTETVRVEEDRVNITKQSDLEVDEEMIDSGWLVEIDNNQDEYQTTLYESSGQRLLLTFKSPQVLSNEQLSYIEREFNDIISCLSNAEYGNEDWMDLVDARSVARHYIVNEIMQNYDGFCGSFFLYKDKGTKWTVGPAWDYGSCLFYDGVERSYLKQYNKAGGPHLIREMLNSVNLRRIILEEWEDFYAKGSDWVFEVANDWAQQIAVAAEYSNLLWGGSDGMYGRRDAVVNRLKNNIEWFNEYVYSDDFNMWEFLDIHDVKIPVSSDRNIYDILGRRIMLPSAVRGIYIVDGHKFVGNGQ